MKVQEFILKLFEIEVLAHIAHLQTKSFAEHTALDELYKGIVDHRDAFIEAYQGEYGIVQGYPVVLHIRENINFIGYLADTCKLVEKYKSALTEGYLQQLVDNIQELLYTVKYKLVNLR